MLHLIAVCTEINPVKTAKIVQGITTIIIVIVVMTSRRMIKEITSSVSMIILLILRRITFTSFREVLLLSQPRATFAL